MHQEIEGQSTLRRSQE